MNMDVYSYTDKGGRSLNEDKYGVKNDPDRCIAVLCDGLGGHNCGEVASASAVDSIISGLAHITSYDSDNIYSVLKTVNEDLILQQSVNPQCYGMRTTSVGFTFQNSQLNYFNVGDSRFYLFQKGSLRKMTKDHSVSQMSVELGEMSFSDIRGDADRNKLLKVMGERIDGKIASIYEPVKLSVGDAVLLCSDGFWEYVLEEEMEIDLSKSQSAKEWVKYMVVRLLLKVDGKNDNFTVVGGIVR